MTIPLRPDPTLRQAATAFRAGDFSPVELLESVLRRIATTEPAIHAYVAVFAEEARDAARNAERLFDQAIDHGPLQGIPVGIKDIFDLAGVPTRCGSEVRALVDPAEFDAVTVARLRQQGAVLIGKTVTQEFAAGVVSAPARNPWAVDRVPGGSSGGSAAAVAVSSCLVAVGSDTGGSIRIPAAVTGTVGLKPTYGSISTGGVFPLSWALDTLGPIGRTVEDAALLLDAMAGRDPGDPLAVASFRRVSDLRGVRLGVPRPHFFERLQSDVRDRVEEALTTLRELGAEVMETPWPDAAAARVVALLLNRIESSAVHESLIRQGPDQMALLNPELRQRLEVGTRIPATTYMRALRAREAIKQSVARLFAEYRLDALVTPTLPATAVAADNPVIVHDDRSEEPVAIGYTRLTMPFNATGQPALSVPCGFDRVGLPVGLQIAGRPHEEQTLCQIGHGYEQAVGWSDQRPPLIGGADHAAAAVATVTTRHIP